MAEKKETDSLIDIKEIRNVKENSLISILNINFIK